MSKSDTCYCSLDMALAPPKKMLLAAGFLMLLRSLGSAWPDDIVRCVVTLYAFKSAARGDTIV